MTRALLTAALFAAFILPASATAQSLPIAAGDRIRLVRAGIPAPQEFTVVAQRADTLHVRMAPGAAVEPIALNAVQNLEVFRERSRSSTLRRRVLIGAGVGALAGGLLVAAADDDDFFADSKGRAIRDRRCRGAVAGGTIGALAGLSGRAGHWETVLAR